MRTLIAIVMMLLGCSAWSQPIQRQFFTTNTNPRVVVAAGTNVTVQYTTTGTDIRTYTVNSAGGGTGQTNWSYTSITNAPWQWGSDNLTNWSQLGTNILSTLFTNSVVAAGTNIIVGTNGLVYTVSVDMGFTNYLASTNYAVTAATNAAYNSTNGFPWTNIYSPGISGGATNQVYTQVGWSGYPQVTNLSLWTNAIGANIVPTLWLTNSTAAALGAQQYSPALAFGGQGWRSGNSTTMPVQMGMYEIVYQGSSVNPSADFTWYSSVSNSAPSTCLQLSSSGNLTASGSIRSSGSSVSAAAASYLSLYGLSRIYSPADQDFRLTDSTGLLFNRLYFGAANALWPALKIESTNAPTLSIRTGADANYASLVASNVTATTSLISSNGLYVYGSNSVHEVDALGTAIYPALWLTNSTAAALGAQQASPALMLGGQGWRSGNSTTMPVSMGMYVLPVQGSSANPSATLYFVRSISNAAPSSLASSVSIATDGTFSAGPISSSSDIAAGGIYSLGWTSLSLMKSPANGDIQMMNQAQNAFSRLYLGKLTADWPAIKVEASTNAPTLSIRTGADANYASLVASNVTASASVTATNGYVHQLYATNGYTVCTQSKQIYMVNSSTNPIFVLPDAATVTGKEFTFTTTNSGTFFIVTNATGAQTIGDGTSFSYTNNNNGQKVSSFVSDGAHWWLGRKGKTILPNASWSCSTNTTFANVTNMITLDTTEANNGVGIALDNSAWFTAGVGSKIWVTNAGMYMLTFSAVWSKVGGGAANGDIWLRQDGVILPRTMTLQTIQNATTTNVMTVNFILPVTKTTYFDLVGASPDGSAQLQAMPAITSPFQRPACPSVIVTIMKTSD